MRYALAVLVIGSLLLVWLLHGGPSPGDPPSAHAATLASVEATSCPAPERVVKLALRQYRAAGRAFDTWQRARRCLSLRRGRLRVEQRPHRDAAAAVWLQAMATWQHQARAFQLRLGKLVDRMRHPKARTGGERWRPLALWVGWTPAEWPTVLYIMAQRWGHGESGGDPKAVNPAPPYCRGLMQLARGWYTGAWKIRGVRQPFDPLDPEANLRSAEGIHDQQGWGPWGL